MRVLLLAALVAMAGCVSLIEDDKGAPGTSTPSPSDEEAPQDGDRALFLMVERGFGFNRTNGSGGSPYLRIGSHCGQASWTLDPAAVEVKAWQEGRADPWPGDGVGVSVIDAAAVHNTSYVTTGTAPEAFAFMTAGHVVPQRRAFGEGVAVEAFVDGDAVTVAGHRLVVGEPHTVRVTYVVNETYGDEVASFRVEESLRFTLVGPATVTTRSTGGPCI